MKSFPKKAGDALHLASTLVGAFLCIIFGALFICNLVIIAKGTLHPDRAPDLFGYTPMVVLSGSMSGTRPGHVEVGDLVIVAPTDKEQLQVGDVAAYMTGNGTLVTHRVVEVREDASGKSYIMQGDANNVADAEPVSPKMIVGKYSWRIPKLGNFALFLQKPLGILLFIGLPILIFILYDLVRRQLEGRRDSSRQAELEAELERLRKIAGEQSTGAAAGTGGKAPAVSEASGSGGKAADSGAALTLSAASGSEEKADDKAVD